MQVNLAVGDYKLVFKGTVSLKECPMLLYINQKLCQPSNFIFIKGSPQNLHTNFTVLYKHMTWNRAKSFEVFGMTCSGLGGFMSSSVVPVDFGIHFPFQVYV